MNQTVQKARSAGSAASAPRPARKAAPRKAAPRTHDAERTQADILEVATREFAEKGLAGARIDAIAEATRTSKRMLYYYYGSKEGLYVAVLEEAYRQIRQHEGELHLDDLPPTEALARLVAFTVEYQLAHPEFARLVATENIHRGEYLKTSRAIQGLNVPAIAGLRQVYERGIQAGLFRPGLDMVDLHMSISALALFNVANRHTFGLIFKRDLGAPRLASQRRDTIVDMVLRFVRA